MTAALFTFLATAGLAAVLAQNQPSPTPATPPASPLGEPNPTSTVPQSGATINAGTGERVTAPNSEQAGATNAAGTAAPRGTAGSATTTTSTNRSNITPVQLQNINRLAIDLNGLGLVTRDPAEQQRGFIENLKAAPVSSVRPSAGSIERLGESVAAVIPTLNLTAPQRRQLAIDLNLALNSGSLTPAEVQRVIADARGILLPGAAQDPDGVERLLAALSGVVAEVQASVTQARQGGSAGASTSPTADRPTPAGTPQLDPAATEAGQGGGSQIGQGSGGSPPPPAR
ncbi:MAG: hypothetical protein AB9869_33770 [Verrucomicrobiia bacterium]